MRWFKKVNHTKFEIEEISYKAFEEDFDAEMDKYYRDISREKVTGCIMLACGIMIVLFVLL